MWEPIIQKDFKNKNGWPLLDLSALIFERVVGFCEHNNETLIL